MAADGDVVLLEEGHHGVRGLIVLHALDLFVVVPLHLVVGCRHCEAGGEEVLVLLRFEDRVARAAPDEEEWPCVG